MNARELKTVFIISLSLIRRDPRVLRQAEALKGLYRVVLAGFGSFSTPGIQYYRLGSGKNGFRRNAIRRITDSIVEGSFFSLLLQKVFSRAPRKAWPFWARMLSGAILSSGYARRIRSIAHSVSPSLVIANDFSSLLPAQEGREEAKFVYDAHEYTPGQSIVSGRYTPRSVFVEYVLQTYLPKCDVVVTVGDGIAGEYAACFGVEKPEVIINAPRFVDQAPSWSRAGNIRLVHHGVAGTKRSLELVIDAVKSLDDRFSLDFYLVKSNEVYYRSLVERANSCKKIRFLEPVAFSEIVYTLNAYDLGIALFPPLTFNLKHVLPNKFFEFIQARLGVAIGPSPEMAAYVRKYDLGVVSEDFTAESLAKSLNALTNEDIMRFKNNAHKYAYELSAEPQMEKLKSIVESLIGK